MANTSKRKGDGGEREAVRILIERAPDLVIEGAQRKLGAGRRLDVGDLEVFPDATVQVKAMANLAAALREAAAGAAIQSVRARTPFSLGMAPVPRARRADVRWLAACHEWPGGAPPADELAVFGTPSAAVAHARRETIGVPRRRRIAVNRRMGLPEVFIAPIEAWLDAYRRARTAPLHDQPPP